MISDRSGPDFGRKEQLLLSKDSPTLCETRTASPTVHYEKEGSKIDDNNTVKYRAHLIDDS